MYHVGCAMLILLILFVVAILIPVVVRPLWQRSRTDRVRMTVIDGPQLAVHKGSSLLHALRNAGVNPPSSCGGQGSCAQCRCRVLRGGGRITDQERPYFSGAEIKAHWRLACRVTVQRDIMVEVPGR